MEDSKKIFSFLSQSFCIGFLLVILTGCLGSAGNALTGRQPPSGGSATQIPAPDPVETTVPPALVGNALMIINDEAPVIRNQVNQPIRLDKESDMASIRYEGQNEE